MNFHDLGLSQKTQEAILALGYVSPTPIQQQAIPQILCGRDVFGCAQTGTGKTAAFLLPIIDILSQASGKSRMPRVVVLEPTRELAAQVFQSFSQFTAGTSLTGALLVGGEMMSDQEKQLRQGADVIIATPGRLLDFVERSLLLLAGAKIFVIDEADRMLDMGFIPDVEKIAGLLPSQKQTLFFSATVPLEIKRLVSTYLVTPKEITITPTIRAAETIEQYFFFMTEKQKLQQIKRVLEKETPTSALIFCNYKRHVNTLANSLRQHGYQAQGLHGDMPQQRRNEALAAFKAGTVPILVASDVAARGLDVEGLSLVINYGVPNNAEEYIHRIGRTGRAGKVGKAITLLTQDEAKAWAAIEALVGEKIAPYVLTTDDKPVKAEKTANPSKKPTAPIKVARPKAPTKAAPVEEKITPPTIVAETVEPPHKQPHKPKTAPIVGFGEFIPDFMRVQ